MTYSEILARLETATGPDREIDIMEDQMRTGRSTVGRRDHIRSLCAGND
jgi:hypothetical protein